MEIVVIKLAPNYTVREEVSLNDLISELTAECPEKEAQIHNLLHSALDMKCSMQITLPVYYNEYTIYFCMDSDEAADVRKTKAW